MIDRLNSDKRARRADMPRFAELRDPRDPDRPPWWLGVSIIVTACFVVWATARIAVALLLAM